MHGVLVPAGALRHSLGAAALQAEAGRVGACTANGACLKMTLVQVQGDAFTALDKRTDELRKQMTATIPRVAGLEERADSAATAAEQQRLELSATVKDLQAQTAEALEICSKGTRRPATLCVPSRCRSATQWRRLCRGRSISGGGKTGCGSAA